MKTFLVLFISMLTFHCLIAGEQKYDERKVIMETIKTNYDRWSVKEMEDEDRKKSDDSISSMVREFDETQTHTITEKNKGKNRFSNFTFKILKSQAVVRFYVDKKLISAFLEKKDGRWQLVCAADITPLL